MATQFSLDKPLAAVGALLARRGRTAAIVVVGGTALNLLRVIDRFTSDVDVIALGRPGRKGAPKRIERPDPLPAALAEAVATVARDLNLAPDWLNTAVGSQWRTGLPRGFAGRISWRRFGGLWVGLAGRADLIRLKLYAAADDVGPASRHFKDLVALRPTDEELAGASRWVKRQDPSGAVTEALKKIVAHVQRTRR